MLLDYALAVLLVVESPVEVIWLRRIGAQVEDDEETASGKLGEGGLLDRANLAVAFLGSCDGRWLIVGERSPGGVLIGCVG